MVMMTNKMVTMTVMNDGDDISDDISDDNGNNEPGSVVAMDSSTTAMTMTITSFETDSNGQA